MSSAALGEELKWKLSRSNMFQPVISEIQSQVEQLKREGRRRSKALRGAPHVKIGHGGTLDPAASGVMTFGIGSGTKALDVFTKNTEKGYEAVMLLGVATDMFDAEGSIVGRKAWDGVTREKVEAALDQFRGKIMQRPSVYSALKRGGLPMYEYARSGQDIPELEKREMFVSKLELVEWMDGGTHPYHWPQAEIAKDRKEAFVKVLRFEEIGGVEIVEGEDVKITEEDTDADISGRKRKQRKTRYSPNRSAEKRLKLDETPGGDDDPTISSENGKQTTSASVEAITGVTQEANDHNATAATSLASEQQKNAVEVAPAHAEAAQEPCPAPALKLRMTVSSGFYVRSLCHDLGVAVGSLGIMSELVRTRQACFELDTNALDYAIFEQGEDVWAPKVAAELDAWKGRHEALLAVRKKEDPVSVD